MKTLDFSKLTDEEKAEHDRLADLVQAYYDVSEDLKAAGLATLQLLEMLSSQMEKHQERVDQFYERIGLIDVPALRIVKD